MSLSSKFGATLPAQNPFATALSNEMAANPFSMNQKPISFGAPSGPLLAINSTSGSSQNPSFNPFAGNSDNPNSTFSISSNPSNSNLQGAQGLDEKRHSGTLSCITSEGPIRSAKSTANYPKVSGSLNTSSRSKLIENDGSSIISTKIPSSLSDKIESQLQKEGIVSPSLATLDYDTDQNEFMKSVAELRKDFLKYRDRVRASLIKANLLDDPNVPKKLKDAIDFKGTCDQMCPDYECVTRMMDRRYDKAEKDIRPDGTLSNLPNPSKMVKALARSAAGQDAPLPGDIRTAAALRKTVDYLFKTLLADRELETIHGFLWDRTRAIRRDFVFHSSMTPSELVDQVYCLERIIRFHAISLHYMSKDGIPTEGFSDQQEREQLSKSLLSLIHAYEDCKSQGVHCENEMEFKAYYILFNGEIPGIMDTVQSWGLEVWGNSETIRSAVSLSESLQNTWDVHGPLYPATTSEISQNAYSKFFSIIENSSVSYTMACFAEIYFNKIRKAILRTILSSYRKQRGQTKDWTAEKLNKFLRFDTEEEVEPFFELYGIQFSETEGERYLSFDSPINIQDPHPLPRQPHSYHLVERKRGKASISEAIDHSIYEKTTPNSDDTPSLFVEDNQGGLHPPFISSKSQADLDADQQGVDISKPEKLHVNSANDHSISNNNENPIFLNDQVIPKNLPTQNLFLGLPSGSAGTGHILSNTILSSSTKIFPAVDASPKLAAPKFNSNDTSISNFYQNSTINSFQFPSRENQYLAIPGTSESNSFPKPSSFTSVTVQPSVPQQKKSVSWSTPVSFVQNQEVFMPLQFNQSYNLLNSSLHLIHKPSDSISTTPQVNFLPFVKGNDKSKENNVSQVSAMTRRQSRLDNLTNWIVNGNHGLVQEFYMMQANKIVGRIFDIFMTEQKMQAQKEAEKSAIFEADNFRWRGLAIKYGYRWRELARLLRLKRNGREAREARRLLAIQTRAEKAELSSIFVEDFKSSVGLRRRPRESQESPLDETGDQSSNFDSISETHSIKRDNRSSHKRLCSERSTTSDNTSTSRTDRYTSDKSLSRSLLSDPSYLSGEPRIHLVSRHLNKDEKRKQISGVQTDYFRLKARGIYTLPQGTKPC